MDTMPSRYYDVRSYIEISPDARKYLSKPLGELYPPENLDLLRNILFEIRRGGRNIIASVGDRVTKTLIDWDIIPDIAVVDCMERRRPVNIVDEKRFKEVFYVDNMRGYINMAIKDLVRKVLSLKPVLIKVGGEDDLVGIPIIYSLDNGDVMIYGQPKQGIVLVRVTPTLKNELDKIIFG